MTREPVDVCIPTFNSAATIANCLKHLKSNLIEDDEVAVYDRFSSDGTPQVVKDFGFDLHQSYDSLGKIRSDILREASKKWVFFLDSDIYVPEGFVEKLLDWASKLDRVGAIQGLPVNTVNAKLNKLDWWIKHERTSYPTVTTYRGSTGNTLVSTEAVEDFNCDWTVFEDYALLQYLRKRGYKWWTVDVQSTHDNPNYRSAALWGGAGIRITRTKPLWKLVAALAWMPAKAPLGTKTIQLECQFYMLVGYLFYRSFLLKRAKPKTTRQPETTSSPT